jgi:hypothetical protein
MTFAAYNARRGQVQEWVAQHVIRGDPTSMRKNSLKHWLYTREA